MSLVKIVACYFRGYIAFRKSNFTPWLWTRLLGKKGLFRKQWRVKPWQVEERVKPSAEGRGNLRKKIHDQFDPGPIDHTRNGSRRVRRYRDPTRRVKWELVKRETRETSVIRFPKRGNPFVDDDPSVVSQHGWLIVKPWSNPQRVATRGEWQRNEWVQTARGRGFKIALRNRRVILYNRDSPDIMRATRDDQFVFSGR